MSRKIEHKILGFLVLSGTPAVSQEQKERRYRLLAQGIDLGRIIFTMSTKEIRKTYMPESLEAAKDSAHHYPPLFLHPLGITRKFKSEAANSINFLTWIGPIE